MKLLLTGILLSFAVASNAFVLVDTGPGPDTLNGTAVNYEDTPFGVRWQSIGGQFQTSTPVTITDVEGWISSNNTSHEGTVSIYSDAGDLPGATLHSTTFTATVGASFQGANGQSWGLAPGTYWAVFEVVPSQIGSTMTMPNGDGTDPANPLSKYASINQDSGGWNQTFVDYSFRLTAVPVPAALPLLLSALVAMGWRGSRKSPSKLS